jgi:hypothetical protein
MEYALINNGVVENVIVADTEFIESISSDHDHIEPLDTAQEQVLGVGIGWGWDGEQFVAPAAPPPPPLPPPPAWQWYIDKGPFFDRFGAAKMAVLTSNDSTIKALLADINNRHWIDLQRADVAQAVGYIGSVVPAVNAALQADILTSPVTETENLALRRLFFGA